MKELTRVERDSMGPMDVPVDAYYGASTQRAVINFPISDMRFSVSRLVSLISADMTLFPGDVILCGTSIGVGSMKPGKFPFANLKFKDDNFPMIPAGIYASCWKPESVAEFSVDEVDGKIGFGTTNLNDTTSADITANNLGELTPDKIYRVRVEYLTQNDAVGKVAIRKPKENYVEFGGVELASTDGKWKTVTFDFTAPTAGTKLDLRSFNGSVGEGNRLLIRKIELIEMK